MFNCSTSWNWAQHDDGEQIIDEIKSLGLNGIELGCSLSENKVAKILQKKEKDTFRIESVHNFCPVPNGYKPEEFMPDYFSLASPDELQRKRAIELTINSMHLAKNAQAKAVIIHAGRVEQKTHTKDLIELYNQGKLGTPLYQELLAKMKQEREQKKEPYICAIKASLKELLILAQELGLMLCIENRYYHREIPSFSEIGELLDSFSKYTSFGYWHDVGHAQVGENLGLDNHVEYLVKYAKKLVGMHIHDVKGAQDHLVPGAGDLNFSILKPYLKKNTIKVLEIHQPAKSEQIKVGISLLNKLGLDQL